MPTPLLGPHVKYLLPWVMVAAALGQSAAPAVLEADRLDPNAVRASLIADRVLIQAGQPVWVTLILSNLTEQPVTLRVPEFGMVAKASAEASDVPAMMGLPLTHVFSGINYTAITVKDEHGDEWDSQVNARPRAPTPVLTLAPCASIGLRMDLGPYYTSLRHPGKYTLVWRPYGGALESAPLALTILAQRQAVIRTEFGDMTMRFYYDEAPNAVQNFIELAEKRFYDHLTFHRIIPSGLIQGGDPLGSGQGVRSDGKRLKAEFSNIPFGPGTVGMARLPSDPDSASCQFFITVSRQAALDGKQTAFGYLVGDESLRTLDKIASVPLDRDGRPRQPVSIRGITLENVPLRLSDTPDSGARGATTRPAIMEDSGSGDSPAPATRPAPADNAPQGPTGITGE